MKQTTHPHAVCLIHFPAFLMMHQTPQAGCHGSASTVQPNCLITTTLHTIHRTDEHCTAMFRALSIQAQAGNGRLRRPKMRFILRLCATFREPVVLPSGAAAVVVLPGRPAGHMGAGTTAKQCRGSILCEVTRGRPTGLATGATCHRLPGTCAPLSDFSHRASTAAMPPGSRPITQVTHWACGGELSPVRPLL